MAASFPPTEENPRCRWEWVSTATPLDVARYGTNPTEPAKWVHEVYAWLYGRLDAAARDRLGLTQHPLTNMALSPSKNGFFPFPCAASRGRSGRLGFVRVHMRSDAKPHESADDFKAAGVKAALAVSEQFNSTAEHVPTGTKEVLYPDVEWAVLDNVGGGSCALSSIIATLASRLSLRMPDDAIATGCLQDDRLQPVPGGPAELAETLASKIQVALDWGYKRFLVVEGQEGLKSECGLNPVWLPPDLGFAILTILQDLWRDTKAYENAYLKVLAAFRSWASREDEVGRYASRIIQETDRFVSEGNPPIMRLEAHRIRAEAWTRASRGDEAEKERAKVGTLDQELAAQGWLLPFDDVFEAHREDFVRREHVVKWLKRHLRRMDKRVLIIQAEPGKGKTALMAHLIEDEELGRPGSKPAFYFYERDDWRPMRRSPIGCIRHLYAQLHRIHDIVGEPPDDIADEHRAARWSRALVDLLGKIKCDERQLIFIDGLEEALPPLSQASLTAYQAIPKDIPAGVCFVVAGRWCDALETLKRRNDADCYNLDCQDVLSANIEDALVYARRHMGDLADKLVDKVATVSGGNFLILTQLRKHLPDIGKQDISEFLDQLARWRDDKDKLGFMYETFWKRATDNLADNARGRLYEVAKLLLSAEVPLTRGMMMDAAEVPSHLWDSTFAPLEQFLRRVDNPYYSERDSERYCYRFFHPSFKAFLSDIMRGSELVESQGDLAKYCLRAWKDEQPGEQPRKGEYARWYALRFGPPHLARSEMWDELAALLTNLEFLEVKAEWHLHQEIPQPTMLPDLFSDFAAVGVMPRNHEKRAILEILGTALRIDSLFLTRHPDCLFQCLWNRCWWYGGREIAAFCASPKGGWMGGSPPWESQAAREVRKLVEDWRVERAVRRPGQVWLRALVPPVPLLGSRTAVPLYDGLDEDLHSVAFSLDGERIAIGGMRWRRGLGTFLAILDAHSKRTPRRLEGHSGIASVRRVEFAYVGTREVLLSAATDDNELLMWPFDGSDPVLLPVREAYGCTWFKWAVCPKGPWLATANVFRDIRLWDLRMPQEIPPTAGKGGPNIAWVADGTGVVTVSDIAENGSIIERSLCTLRLRLWVLDEKKRVLIKANSVALKGDRLVSLVASNCPSRPHVIALTSQSKGDILVNVATVRSGSLRMLESFTADSTTCGPAALSPDGNQLAVANVSGDVLIVSVQTGETLLSLSARSHPSSTWRRLENGRITTTAWDPKRVRSLAWAPDGRRLAAVLDGSYLFVWDMTVRPEIDGLACPPVKKLIFGEPADGYASSDDGRGPVECAQAVRECLGEIEADLLYGLDEEGRGRVAFILPKRDEDKVRCASVLRFCGSLPEPTESKLPSASSPPPVCFALPRRFETTVSAITGSDSDLWYSAAFAWWPDPLSKLVSHHSGTLWAGIRDGSVQVFCLEGYV
jgi:WD40 repeat protein